MKIEAYKTWRYDWSRRTDMALDCETFELRAIELEITPSGSGRASLSFDVRPTGREFFVQKAISISMIAMQSARAFQRYVLEMITRMAVQTLIKVALTEEFPEMFPALAAAGNNEQCDGTFQDILDEDDNRTAPEQVRMPPPYPDQAFEGRVVIGDSRCNYDQSDKTAEACAARFDNPWFDFSAVPKLPAPTKKDTRECEHCFGTGLLHGFQVPCPSGCPLKT